VHEVCQQYGGLVLWRSDTEAGVPALGTAEPVLVLLEAGLASMLAEHEAAAAWSAASAADTEAAFAAQNTTKWRNLPVNWSVFLAVNGKVRSWF